MRAGLAHHASRVLAAFGMVLAVAWIAFAGVVLLLRYAILPNVGDYKPQLERLAAKASGETVRIGDIGVTWRGLRPSFALTALQIVDGQGVSLLELPSVRATLSWESLVLFEVRLAALEIDAPQLTIRRDADGAFFVGGFPVRRKAQPDNRLGEWLLAQNAIRIHDARIVWRDEMPDPAATSATHDDLVLTDVDFAVERSGRRHRLALHATPPVALAAPVDLRAAIDHPLFARRLADPTRWRGTVYADVATGDVVAWRHWLPLPATIDGGRGRARVWLDFTDASTLAGAFATRLAARTQRPGLAQLDRIAAVTADLALDDVAVRWGMTEYSALASIDGRVAASQSPTDQRFAATRMALQPRDGNLVPPTDFEIRRTVGATPDDETGSASLGAIDIGVSIGLVPTPLVPPAVAEKFAALKPRGVLSRMALHWTGPIATPKVLDIEAGFERLAIAAQPPTAEAIAAAAREFVLPNGLVRKPHAPFGQPGFDNLNGSLKASRANGTTTVAATLDGSDATLTAPGLFDEPTLRLARIAAQVGVVAHDADVEVKVEHGAIENADLAGTIDLVFRHGPNSGSWNAATASGRGWIDLDARLTRAEVERVPRYLPNIIGEKARRYLRKSLLGGKVTEATFRMKGALERLDLRQMPGAQATPNPVTVPNALVAVRDGGKAMATTMTQPAGDEATFHALIKVKGATFLYGPLRDPDAPAPMVNGVAQAVLPSIAWPVFEDLDADVIFDQAQLTVLGHSTRAFGFRLTDIRAELPALADPAHVLRVVGRGSGPLQDLVRFINESPVARWTRNFTAPTRATGDALFALALDLPLTHPRDAEVAGSLQFRDNELAVAPAIPPLKKINGRLDFTDRAVTIDGISAQSLGGPLRIDARPGADGFIDFAARGTIDVAAFRASVAGDVGAAVSTTVSAAIERAAPFVTGTTDYAVTARLRSRRVGDVASEGPPTPTAAVAAEKKPDLVIESNLVGLALALPAPLTKAAGESWPLRIELARVPGTATSVESEDIRIALADRVKARISRQRDAGGGITVARAAYGVGDVELASEGAPELRIDVPTLDVDAWRDVARQAAAVRTQSAQPVSTGGVDSLLPERASLRTPLLRVAGRDFDHVALDVRRSPSGWEADVTADQVAGRLSYLDVSGRAPARGVAPASSGKVVARLSRLAIPPTEPGQATAETSANAAVDRAAQKDFPAIDVVVDDFQLRGRPLGRLEVVAENVDAGPVREWQLEKLGLTMPEARFSARGAWGHRIDGSEGRDNTRLDFAIEAADVGALMDRFGLTRTIKNGNARLTGNAAWSGGPTTIDFATMTGALALEADKGQFLKADPGIAKLLNILSLQGLARRLTLDFNDVFEAGFAFDTVRADATVDHGIATTDNFRMKGVQATVTMSGSADLERETTDLHVRVVPDINAGAASLGVAVVNPVLGLATFAAQYLFKDRISEALAFEYNVAGPWKQPEVTKIDRDGKATPVVPRKPLAASESSNEAAGRTR